MKNDDLALLACLYLTRSGRVNISEIADGLGLYLSKLTPVLNLLKKSKIVTLVGEEYELEGHPTVGDVLKAIGFDIALNHKKFKTSTTEHRALHNFANNLNKALSPFLNKTIRSIDNDLIMAELDIMNQCNEGTTS